MLMCVGVYEGGSGAELIVPYIEGKIFVEETNKTPLRCHPQSLLGG